MHFRVICRRKKKHNNREHEGKEEKKFRKSYFSLFTTFLRTFHLFAWHKHMRILILFASLVSFPIFVILLLLLLLTFAMKKKKEN